jgi:pimeloyl-ACP methyl ester carboxylesterase
MFRGPLPEKTTVMGAEIEFARLGSGRPLLYLHGCDGLDVDDPFLEPLAHYFDVIALSLPGFGGSDLPQDMSNVGDVAELCLQFATQLRLNDSVLVGASFGGWVAAEMSIRRSGVFSNLVLADALGARFTKRPEEIEIFDVFTVSTSEHPYAYFLDRERAEKAFGKMDFKAMPEGAALRYCRNREALTTFGWAPLLHSPTLRRRLGLINVPTLVLWGKNDRVVSADYGRLYAAAIPGAQFREVEGAGHYLPMEQPAQFVEQVVSFAGKVPS